MAMLNDQWFTIPMKAWNLCRAIGLDLAYADSAVPWRPWRVRWPSMANDAYDVYYIYTIYILYI